MTHRDEYGNSTVWHSNKRFSEFDAVQRQLQKLNYRAVKAFRLTLGTKRVALNKTSKFIAKREGLIDRWLQTVTSEDFLRQHAGFEPIIAKFLQREHVGVAETTVSHTVSGE